MEVILSKHVEKLGKAGDVVKVKEGYARNFLLPRKLALPATKANLGRIERQKAAAVTESENLRKQAEETAEKISKVSCTITVEVNDQEKLYGSVSEADIAKALADEGFPVDKKDIVLDTPIQDLGIFEVNIKLHPEVQAKVRVWVAKK